MAAPTIEWVTQPPASVALYTSFSVGVQSDDPESGIGGMTLYKNGVFLGEASSQEEETGCGIYVTTSISANNATFYAVAQSQTSGTVSLTALANETTPPSIPANLAASGANSTSVTISWSASTDNVGVTGYELKYNSTSLGTATGTSRNVTGLSPGTLYSFTVRARDAFGNWSNWSSALNVTLVDVTPPTTPTSLSVGSVTHASIGLTWTGSTDDVAVTGYNILRTRDGQTALVGFVAVGTTSFTDSHVQPGLMYSYAVKAKDAAGNQSEASNSVSATASSVPDSDSDGIPDGVEVIFGIQGSPNPSTDSALNLKVMRPSQ